MPLDREEVLLGERLGRRHQRALAARLDRAQERVERDDRLAGADVALEQALHRRRAREVGVDLGDRLLLVLGQLERQRGAVARRSARPARGSAAATCSSRSAVRRASASWSTSSSSNASRCLPSSASSSERGLWIATSASASERQPALGLQRGRQRVGMVAQRCGSAASTSSRSFAAEISSLAG